MIPAVLTIGGSDSGGGAGIQADLNTFQHFGIKGCSALTALTAQNPSRITRIEAVSLEQLEAEVRAAFAYYDIKAVKTGMLYDSQRLLLVAELLEELHIGKPLIIDPVMISTSGSALLDGSAIKALKQSLFPLASLITPNIPEAEHLLGSQVDKESAAALFTELSVPILLKGGHIRGNRLIDILYCDGEEIAFPHDRQNWDEEQSHGTGCRLASAIAAGMAQEKSLSVAVNEAIRWLQEPLSDR